MTKGRITAAITPLPIVPALTICERVGSGDEPREVRPRNTKSNTSPLAITERGMCNGTVAPGMARKISPVITARKLDIQRRRVVNASNVKNAAMRKNVSVFRVNWRARLDAYPSTTNNAARAATSARSLVPRRLLYFSIAFSSWWVV